MQIWPDPFVFRCMSAVQHVNPACKEHIGETRLRLRDSLARNCVGRVIWSTIANMLGHEFLAEKQRRHRHAIAMCSKHASK